MRATVWVLSLIHIFAGFVQDVLVEDNQPVKAGQLLARLDDRDFRTALAAAEADVLGAEANLCLLYTSRCV